MDTLHKELDRLLGNVPRHMLSEMIRKKVRTQGVNLSESELTRFVDHVLDDGSDTFTFRHWQWWNRKIATVEITKEDVEAIKKNLEWFLDEKCEDLVQSVISDLSSEVLSSLKQSWPRQSRRQLRDMKSFRKRLAARWGNALEPLRMLLTIAREFGESLHHELGNREENKEPHLAAVLTRLQARGCQVTEEIICLLSAGLADGAMARWRTLHEIAVVALLMDTHGEELAERYVLHEVVESRDAAKKFEEFH